MKIPARRALSGLTLLEILVALFILSLVMAGLGNIFLVGKRYMLHSKSRAAALEFAKYLLSPFPAAVRQDSYDTGLLNVTASAKSGEDVYLDYISYTSSFNISNVTVGSSLVRKVNLTVKWNETAF